MLEQRVLHEFLKHFAVQPEVLVQAPGRVNLIGEHTDYNEGFVLPCAINFRTVVAARTRTDRQVRVLALDQAYAQDQFSLDEPIVPRLDLDWPNYIRGMVLEMLRAHPELPGADLVVAGDVPLGAGLSSSASLEVAIGKAFKRLANLTALQPQDLALMAQRAENEFVGCKCGIMDQMVSACGVVGHALLIDCRSLVYNVVPMPEDMVVLIMHSNVRRGLVDSAYNERRQQCEVAARHFGVSALRDLNMERLLSDAQGLDSTIFRRARHVVSENQRALDAADALRHGKLDALGRLMAASHVSMRDDFEITTPAIDSLVEIAGAEIGSEGGVRMTGGGFGGCVVALTTPTRAELTMQRVAREYRSPEGLAATSFVCRASAGTGPLPMPAPSSLVDSD